MATNAKTDGNPTNVPAQKTVLPEIHPYNRYIMNGEELGLTLPVRIHETIPAERAAQIIKTPAFVQYMAEVTRNRGAIAVPASMRPMAIPFPSNILGQKAGQGNGQTFDRSMLVDQLRGIIQMYGADMGALKKPLKNARIGDVTSEGNKSFMNITLANGKKIMLTIIEEVEK